MLNLLEKELYKTNGKPSFQITEEEVLVKNIFNEDDRKMFEHLLKKTMGLTDEDQLPDGMLETPERLCKFWTENLAMGYIQDPERHLKKCFDISRATPEEKGEFTHGIVHCRFKAFSTCCHHIAPFGTFREDSWVHLLYIPNEKVVGLSKIPRAVREMGKKFQIQEQWAEDVCDSFMRVLQPQGVMLIFQNMTHSCVSTRGAKSESATTTTSTIRGIFETDAQARTEALALVSL